MLVQVAGGHLRVPGEDGLEHRAVGSNSTHECKQLLELQPLLLLLCFDWTRYLIIAWTGVGGNETCSPSAIASLMLHSCIQIIKAS